jgi:CRP/FNR family transcriptional regulator, cyclic AMP receptor protein
VAAQKNPSASSSTAERPEARGLIERALPGSRRETSAFLAETAHIRSVRKDERIFRQGEPIPLTLVVSGYGAFRRTTVEGQQVTVGIAEPGGLYGFSTIASAQSTVDLVALTDCEVALWRGPEVRQLTTTDSGFALAVIEQMATYLSMITEKVDGFLHQNARRRVVRILARHQDLFFASPAVLSRSHLPSLVGTSREMTGRVLRELEAEGTLARDGRTGLKLLRPDRLDADAARPSPDVNRP